MENASKALLIAGGVLISLIIIAVGLKTYSSIGSFQKAKISEEEQERLIAFNERFTKYLGQYVYGTEVITITNMAADSEYDIGVNATMLDEYPYWIKPKYGTKWKKVTVSSGKNIKLDVFITGDNIGGRTSSDSAEYIEENITGLKNRAFKCTNIGYDNSGRVNSITFEEVSWNSDKE